jgi:hypothetical protein
VREVPSEDGDTYPAFLGDSLRRNLLSQYIAELRMKIYLAVLSSELNWQTF